MIYGPRDDEELAIIERILKAGVGYMTDCREGRLKLMLDAVKTMICNCMTPDACTIDEESLTDFLHVTWIKASVNTRNRIASVA